MFNRTTPSALAAALGLALCTSAVPAEVDDQADKAPPEEPVLTQHEKGQPRVMPTVHRGPLGDRAFKYPAFKIPAKQLIVPCNRPKDLIPEDDGSLGDTYHEYEIVDVPGLRDLSKAHKEDDDGCGFIGDVDRNGVFDYFDVVELLSQWGACRGCTGDLNGDGWVDVRDLVRILSFFDAESDPGSEVRKGGHIWNDSPKLPRRGTGGDGFGQR